jgi:hypothetical protein
MARRVAAAAAVAAFGLLLLPSGGDAFSQRAKHRSVDAAFHYWRSFSAKLVRDQDGRPCRDVEVKLVGEGQLGPGWIGEATYGACRRRDERRVIKVSKKYARSASRTDVCVVVVHEFGHLAGLGHSRHKKSVMYSPGFLGPFGETVQEPTDKDIPSRATEKRAKNRCRKAL